MSYEEGCDYLQKLIKEHLDAALRTRFPAFAQALPEPSPSPAMASVPVASGKDALASLDEAMALHIRQALVMAGGKINGPGGAAEILRIHPNTLRKRMQKLNILLGRDITP